MSNVKIWSHKLRRYHSIKPKGLVLFPENIGKCWNCGFYRNNCMCNYHVPLKTKIHQWFIKKIIGYHTRRKSNLMRRSNKFEQKAIKHHNIVRNHQESKRNWKEVSLNELISKNNGG